MMGRLSADFWRSAELLVAIILTLVAAGVFYLSRSYPNVPWSMGGPPGFYPQLLALGLFALSVLIAGEGIRSPTRIQGISRWTLLNLMIGLGSLALGVALMRWLGFRIVATFMAFAMMIVLVDDPRLRRPLGMALLLLGSIGVGLALGYVFEDLAGRRLPAGTIFR